MKILKQILSELRELKKALQTIASSLEREKGIDIHQAAEALAKPWRVGDIKAVINIDTDAVVKRVQDSLIKKTNIGKDINEISSEKKEWLREIGAIDIENFKYFIPSNQHMFSSSYLGNNSLVTIKQEYKSLYPNI